MSSRPPEAEFRSNIALRVVFEGSPDIATGMDLREALRELEIPFRRVSVQRRTHGPTQHIEIPDDVDPDDAFIVQVDLGFVVERDDIDRVFKAIRKTWTRVLGGPSVVTEYLFTREQ